MSDNLAVSLLIITICIMILLTWGSPDLIDALIYYLSDGNLSTLKE